MRRAAVAELKALANARPREVLAWCGVRETPNASGRIVMCNPRRDDKHPSMAIWTHGGSISWKDFATGDTGDVFDLVSYLNGWYERPHRGFPEAATFLADKLGMARMSAAERGRLVQAAKAHVPSRDEIKQRDEELARRAFSAWLSCMPIRNTVVETYLRGPRNINLDRLPRGPRGGDRFPSILRMQPQMKHIATRSQVESYWPCMVAGCVNPMQGKIVAIHRTWLAWDGSDKAPVEPPRKCWPTVAGLVIPLWRGADWLPVRGAIDAGVRETLVLIEGIETGLSAIIAAPQYRTWAFISLGNLANVRLPENVDSVMLHRETEPENIAAVEAFERGKTALQRQGRPVVEFTSFSGKDLNDADRTR